MRVAALITLCVALAGCSRSPDHPEVGNGTDNLVLANLSNANAEPGAAKFDITKVAISNVPLGAFPYFTLPQGYTSEQYGKTNKDFARFPFWVKGEPVWVEGQFYGAVFVPEQGKDASEYEIKKNFDNIIAKLGGVKLSEEKIPSDTVKSWGDEITQGFIDGLGDVYNLPATTYLIRRNDGNIWVHLVPGGGTSGYIVGREKGFVPTVSILPADQLKQAIDRDGKATVQVNFATDASQILPTSRTQIDAITTVLKGDEKLRLAINGHTDDSGNSQHNQSLSERRAASVKQALVNAGIAADRLTAKGLGSTVPIAGNDSEEGKAQNRRVELVRL